LGEFSRFTRFEVGGGSKIRFWHDVCCGDQTLTVAFSEIFNIARLKDASVTEHLQFLMTLFSGTLILSKRHMTKRSISLFPFSTFCIHQIEMGCEDKLC
jgi:hypothetical protein